MIQQLADPVDVMRYSVLKNDEQVPEAMKQTPPYVPALPLQLHYVPSDFSLYRHIGHIDKGEVRSQPFGFRELHPLENSHISP